MEHELDLDFFDLLDDMNGALLDIKNANILAQSALSELATQPPPNEKTLCFLSVAVELSERAKEELDETIANFHSLLHA